MNSFIPPSARRQQFAALLGMIFLAGQIPKAFALGDCFDYSAGNIETTSGGLWVTAGSKSGTFLPVMVTSSTNPEAQFSAATTQFVQRFIPPLDDRSYLRFKITVDTLPTAGTGDYFMALRDAADNRRARIFIALDSSGTGGKYKLGICFANFPVWTGTALNLQPGQSHTVVARIDYSGTSRAVDLWVDPTDETSPSYSSTDSSSKWTYNAVMLRPSAGNGGTGSLRIDDLFVGSTWNEVTGTVFDVTRLASGTSATANNAADDDQPGIQNALNLAKTGGGIVYLPTGTYHLTGTVTSGSVASGTNAVLTYLSGTKNVTVDGSGSTFIIRKSLATSGTDADTYKPATVLYTTSSQNLTLKGLTTDWQRVPFSVATVSNTGTMTPETGFVRKYSFTATLDPGYRIPDPAGWPVTALSDLILSGTGASAQLLPVCNVTAFQNKPSTVHIIDTIFHDTGTSQYYDVTVRVPTNGYVGNFDPTFASLDNRKVVLRHPTGLTAYDIYGPNAYEFASCATITLRDFVLNASTGMGLKFYDSQAINLTRLSITPGAGRPMSTLVDGAFFTSCRSGTNASVNDITIESSTFRGTGDDATNIHSKYMLIAAIDSGTLSVLPISSDKGPVPKIGDAFEFFSGTDQIRVTHSGTGGLAISSTAVVQSAVASTIVVGSATHSCLKLGFGSSPIQLPQDSMGVSGTYSPALNDFVISMNQRPKVLVQNTLYESSYARGLLLSTDAPVVRNCTFRYNAYNGILFVAQPFGSGCQGPGPTGAVLDGDLFEGCGASPIGTLSFAGRWLSSSGTWTGANYTSNLQPAAPGTFRDLTISGTGGTFQINKEGPLPLNTYRYRCTTTSLAGSGTEPPVNHYVQAGVYLTAMGSTKPEDPDVTHYTNTLGLTMSGTDASSGFRPAVFMNHVRHITLYPVIAPGQLWGNTTYDAEPPTVLDPDFGVLDGHCQPIPPITPDYLYPNEDQSAIGDTAIRGKPFQISDLRPQ